MSGYNNLQVSRKCQMAKIGRNREEEMKKKRLMEMKRKRSRRKKRTRRRGEM